MLQYLSECLYVCVSV